MLDAIRFQLFLATFSGWVCRRQAATISYLIEENRVLKEQLKGRRLRLTDDQPRRLGIEVTARLSGLLKYYGRRAA